MDGLPVCQRPLRGGHRPGTADYRDAGFHSGLPPGARGGRAAEPRPAVRTALFWHIPWPYPDRLRICPWRQEILRGLLANDMIAFQLERDHRAFRPGSPRGARARCRSRRRPGQSRRPRHHHHLGADWRRLRSHSVHQRRRRLLRNRNGFASGSASMPPSWDSASIASITRRASGAARGARRPLHREAAAARPPHVPADRRPVAIEPRSYARHRGRDASRR